MNRSAARAVALCAVAAAVALTALAKDEKPVPAPKIDPSKYESPPVGDLRVFPADNPWNQDVSKLKVHERSGAWIASIGLEATLHIDCGREWKGNLCGIPYVVVDSKQPKVPVEFAAYPGESDRGPYPVPLDAPIEGGDESGGDRHVIAVDRERKVLYELYRAFRVPGGWKADCGAVFDLTSNRLRPAGWTSADAAGLPIFPGLLRWEECGDAGEIRHALRFTCRRTQRAYVAPATHFASRSADENLPPMGMRVRLKATVEESKFPKAVRPVVKAMKTYGLLLADNGSDWFVTGAPDRRWDEDALRALAAIRGSDFEALDTGKLVTR